MSAVAGSHCGSVTVVCFGGRVFPEWAKSTSIRGQEKHKEAVLSWVGHEWEVTGTRRESTERGQETMTEQFGGWKAALGSEPCCGWRWSGILFVLGFSWRMNACHDISSDWCVCQSEPLQKFHASFKARMHLWCKESVEATGGSFIDPAQKVLTFWCVQINPVLWNINFRTSSY